LVYLGRVASDSERSLEAANDTATDPSAYRSDRDRLRTQKRSEYSAPDPTADTTLNRAFVTSTYDICDGLNVVFDKRQRMVDYAACDFFRTMNEFPTEFRDFTEETYILYASPVQLRLVVLL